MSDQHLQLQVILLAFSVHLQNWHFPQIPLTFSPEEIQSAEDPEFTVESGVKNMPAIAYFMLMFTTYLMKNSSWNKQVKIFALFAVLFSWN